MTIAGASAAQSKDAGKDSKEIEKLQKQFDAARAEMTSAEAKLIDAYLVTHDAWKRYRADLRSLRDPLVAGIRTRAPGFLERITVGKNGKAPAPQQQTQIAGEWLTAALEASSVEPNMHAPLAALLAEPLAKVLSNPASEDLERAVDTALGPLFDPKLEFPALWNGSWFKHLPDASDYAAKFSAYREMGVRLEKARSPEKFDDSGQRLPPGMVYVKGGSYEIGPDQGFPRKGLDKRGTKVSVKSFFIDRTEVTNADYLKFLKSLPPAERAARLPSTFTLGEDNEPKAPKDRDDHPVVGVSFNDAFAYAKAIGKRLPTEVEWEAAARGSKGLKYPWGDEYQSGLANDRNAGRQDTAPVGSFPDGASSCGCVDLAGNVEEWTASNAKGDTIETELASSLDLAVSRGGNFNSPHESITCTFRWQSPGLTTKSDKLGFRCAMSVPK